LNSSSLKLLEDLFPTPGAFLFHAEEPKPEDLPSSTGLDAQGNAHGRLGRSSLADEEKGLIAKHYVIFFA
jgi:hypothetical protein